MIHFRRLLLAACIIIPSICHAQLRKGEASIEFRIRSDEYVAVVNRAGWSTARSVRLCHRDSLSGMPVNAYLYNEFNANKVYRLIFAPVEKYLKEGDNIYFTPAGVLFNCNLAAFADNNGKRLCDKYHFFRLSDIRAFPKDSKNHKYQHVILFGSMNFNASPYEINDYCWQYHTQDKQAMVEDIDYREESGSIGLGTYLDGNWAGINGLAESRQEIKYIRSLNKFFTSVYTGTKACEELFKIEARWDSDYIVHISTLSLCSDITFSDTDSYEEFHDKILKKYGLLFSGGGWTLNGGHKYIAHTPDQNSLHHPINDGLLYGAEIARMDMRNCDLVTLAACNTATGIVTQNGILGLQTAFKEAGVRSILMTLWSVNDKATAEFMKLFYTYLFAGNSKHESLELARKDFMNSPDYNHPLYWAPFILLD